MNLELLAHASLKLKNNNHVSLITDPWFVRSVFFHHGSCALNLKIDEKIYNNTDFIYLTHWHFDHFDYKTLRKFSKETKIYVPEFPSSIMRQELNKLGFKIFVR